MRGFMDVPTRLVKTHQGKCMYYYIGIGLRRPARQPLHGTNWTLIPPCVGPRLRSEPCLSSYLENKNAPYTPPGHMKFH